MSMPETITIKNGKELRKWSIFAFTVISAIIVGVTAWVSLQKQVEKNGETLVRECGSLKIKFDQLGSDGSILAHQNQRDIIALKKDIQYTAITVGKIADRVGVVQ